MFEFANCINYIFICSFACNRGHDSDRYIVRRGTTYCEFKIVPGIALYYVLVL